jgi:hypothetical protein
LSLVVFALAVGGQDDSGFVEEALAKPLTKADGLLEPFLVLG